MVGVSGLGSRGEPGKDETELWWDRQWRMGERQLTDCLPVAHPLSLSAFLILFTEDWYYFDVWAIDGRMGEENVWEWRKGSFETAAG